MAQYVLGCVLLNCGASADRQRGREMLTQIREACIKQRYLLSELPIFDIYLGREQVRGDERDPGIAAIRKSLEAMVTHGQVGYYIPAFGVLVDALLDRGADSDLTDAEAAIARLAAAPAEGSVIRDVWLLRLRALLARARGDDAGYRDLRDRYREMAKSRYFEGHMAWAEAMP